jgi:phospholipid/cholesterol/gamma-HCH transport system substrate-binding protein
METKANYVLIGMFTLAVIAGIFGFVYWFQNAGGTRERVPYRIVFQGSVAGLHTGANVLLNGIQVGDVTSLKLDPQRPKEVAALVNIDKSVQIHSDVEVGLEFQGLTGVAQIALKGGTPDSPILQSSKEKPALLTALPAATLDFTQAARDTLRRLDDFVAANQDIINDALKNIDTFTGALARNSERLDKIVAGGSGPDRRRRRQGRQAQRSGEIDPNAVRQSRPAHRGAIGQSQPAAGQRQQTYRGRRQRPAPHAGHDRYGSEKLRQEPEPPDLRRQRQQIAAYSAAPPAAAEGTGVAPWTTVSGEAAATMGRRTTIQ